MPADPNRVRDLFLAAVELRPDQRPDYLAGACGGDADLRAEVERLLLAHADPDSILEPPAPDPVDATGTFGAEPDARAGAPSDFPPFGATGTFGGTETRPARSTAAEIGTVLAGRYALVAVIGEGGMGSVYLASQSEPVKRQVALKLIKAGMDSKGVLARFDAERQALALMDHPNIARIYDGGVTDKGQPFFVMELVQGVPLTEYCDQKRLTVDARLQLFVAVCQAVQHAHQKGIIHRDLKPSNVLVTEVDGKPTPKVIDFGVAKATEQKLTELSFADVGAIVGTPAYMSPEQADPTSMDIDTRTDVYALGVMLYELLTGSPPLDTKQFKRGAVLEMLRMVREVEPPRPSTKLSATDALPNIAANRGTEPAKLAKSLQGELDWVVMKALEKDRTRRYDSANGLADDVQRYLADEVVEARPPSTGYRLKKFVKRNKAQVVAAGLVLLALVGGIVGTSLGMLRAETARRAEEEQRRTADRERDKAEGLAEKNAKLATANAQLAEEEASAKRAATKLAEDNSKLAADERSAKNAALEATREREQQLLRTKAILLNSQLERVAQVQERDPTAALTLLHDTDACPLDMRDMAWNFLERACRRHQVAAFTLPEARLLRLQTISADGKWLALVVDHSKPDPKGVPGQSETEGKVTVIEIPSGKVRTELPPFPDSVHCLAFSPDGGKLAVVTSGPIGRIRDEKGELVPRVKIPGKVQIWDVAETKKVATLEGHTDHILTVAFGPDGTRLATGSMDATARVWDLKTAKELHSFPQHGKAVPAVAFSPNGQRLATGGLDNTVKVWDLDGFKLVSTWTPAANPNPEWAAKRDLDLSVFPGRNVGAGLAGTSDGVIDLDFSPDGTSVVSANANWLIEIRDVASGQLRTTLRDFNTPAPWVRFHRDGKSVFVAQYMTALAVTQWDATTGQQLLRLPCVYPQQLPGAFSKERSLFATTGHARGRAAAAQEIHGDAISTPVYECRVLDLGAPVERALLKTEKVSGNAAIPVFSPTGDVLAVGCGNRVFLWDVRTGQLRKTLVGHKNHVVGLAFSPDGRALATSSTNGFNAAILGRLPEFGPDDVRLWDVATGEPLGTIPMGQPAIPSVAFSPDGATLATLHWTGGDLLGKGGTAVMSVWDVKTRQLRFTIERAIDSASILGGLQERSRLAFNPADGTLVLLAGRFIGIWNLETRKLQRHFFAGAAGTSGASEFVSMALRPDGKWIATVGSKLGTIDLKIWNLETGELVKTLNGTQAQFVAFGPDGKNLLTMAGGTVRIWDALTFQNRASFEAHQFTPTMRRILALAISPDGQTIATAVLPQAAGQPDNLREGSVEVKLWDVSRSPTRITFPASRLLFSKFSYSSDSKNLLEASASEGVLRIWDLGTGGVLSTVDTSQNKIGTVTTPDGRYLAALDMEGPEAAKFALFSRTPGEAQAVVNLWDLKTSTLQTVRVGKGAPTGLAFSPDGKTMAILHRVTLRSSGDKVGKNETSYSVEFWDRAEGRATANWPITGMHLLNPVFSPDGGTLVLNASSDGHPEYRGHRTLLLDVRTGRVLHALKEPGEGELFYAAFKFTQDGTRLLVRRGAGTDPITMWDWKAGKRVDGPIPDSAFNTDVSPDGRYELKRMLYGVEVIDRTGKPPAVVSQRRQP